MTERKMRRYFAANLDNVIDPDRMEQEVEFILENVKDEKLDTDVKHIHRWFVPTVATACIIICVAVVVPKFVIHTNMGRSEYVKSNEYCEQEIDEIEIGDSQFIFNQVDEVQNLSEIFQEHYSGIEETVVEQDTSLLNRFCIFTNLNLEDNESFTDKYYYIDDGNQVSGAHFYYSSVFRDESSSEVDYTIECFVSDTKLVEYEDESFIQSTINDIPFEIVYDNILYTMEDDEDMDMFRSNICAIMNLDEKYYYFVGTADDDLEMYTGAFCNALYNVDKDIEHNV